MSAILKLLLNLAVAIRDFVHPGVNQTGMQRFGSFLTILTALGTLAAFIASNLPTDPTPSPVPAQDVLPAVDVHPDVPEVQDGSTGILDVDAPRVIVAPDVDVPAEVPVTGFLVGCSGAQVQAIKASSADLLACFANIGAAEATVALEQWGQGYKINAEDMGMDALGKAMPCLLKFGAVAVSTYVLPAGRWGGSAGEKNVYRGDGIEIIVSPKRK